MDNSNQKPLNLAAMREKLAGKTGQQYWRSLEELAETPGFREILEDEFPQQARPLQMPVDRRKFLMLSGASLALAGLSGCRFLPQKKIVSYVEKPEDMTLGLPLTFATSISLNGYATGVLATSHEGRPTKLEGNPDHPASLGAIDSITQATILTLYDPDRSQNVVKSGAISSWETFLTETRKNLETPGVKLRILTETITSPTLADQLQKVLAQYPGAKWHQYDPCGRDNVREGAKIAFGEPVNTVYHFEKAERILSLDADFLYALPGSLHYAHDFIAKRRVRTKDITQAVDGSAVKEQAAGSTMNRLYSLETMYSITGAMADHRLPVKPSEVEAAARYLASKLVNAPSATNNGGALPASIPQNWMDALVEDLKGAANGASLVVVGDNQPPAVHALAHAMNDALGAVGSTVVYTAPVEANPENQLESLKSLTADMSSGQVDMLFILGGNPVYNAPVDLNFIGGLRRVKQKIHLGLFDDETSLICDWHLPETHPLEAWGDTRAYDGTVSLVQPLIAPLYEDKSAHDLLSALLAPPEDAEKMKGQGGKEMGAMLSSYDVIHEFWSRKGNTVAAELAPGVTGLAAKEFEDKFQTVLHDGFFTGSALPAKTFKLAVAKATAPSVAPASGSGTEISFLPDPSIHDGRFCNNGWLQELPNPITKLCWDNAAHISPAMAVKLGLATVGNESQADDKLVEVTFQNRKLKLPVMVLPGHADDSVTIHLGYGRTRAGQLGTGAGFNAYLLRSSDSMGSGKDATITVSGGTYDLAHTRESHSMEADPHELIVVATIDEFNKTHLEKKSEDVKPPTADESMYAEAQKTDHKYEGFGAYSWGMSIDNNSCIGCNACVSACQAENNISIVGKDEIRRGRDMLWLRIDTYYRGKTSNPHSFFEPVPCMHCELAPCEPVCPVAATVHSHEGLNMQVYNRCVGTKYCSNNCPYRVRRFNFYKYSAGQPSPEKMTTNYDSPVIKLSANPEVTIRGRGIMEKCTYCVQRINSRRIEAKKEEREIKDGEILTACQQSCPTQAIVFGNIADKNSMVSQLKQEPHDYTLLADLNTRPRTTYLARLRNPHPALAAESDPPTASDKGGE